MNKSYYNSLLFICFISFYGAVVYYLYQLNYWGIFLTLFLSIITFILLNKANKVKDEIGITYENKNWLLIVGYWLLIIFNFTILFKSATTESVISPWEVIPWYFWVIFILNSILLIAIILKTKLSSQIILLLVTGYWLLVTSVVLIIYTIGFGFDPFIHEATEKLIASQGFVDPKPLYYLGQYSLIVILHKIFLIPISILNTWLVPVLTSIFLPPALFSAIKNFGTQTKTALLSTLFILILPFSFFTITTPQNLAYLFLILLILLSLIPEEKFRNLPAGRQGSKFLILNSVALATFAVHPIAGIPAILFMAMLFGKKLIQNKKLFTIYSLLLTIASALALPTAFYLNNKTNTVINSQAEVASIPMFQMPELFFSDSASFILNLVYLYGFNIGIIIFLFILAGIIFYKKILNIHLLMSLSLFASYFITKFVNFSYLIDYERSNFSNRILLMAIFFSLPFILISLSTLIKKILEQEKIIKYSMLYFFIFLLSCSLYISYPRHDDYFNSRSYPTSQADIDAVRWIDANAENDNFIVLANQQVSAGALHEFGFKKYYTIAPSPYQGEGRGEVEIFYYPIPTGEKLYQYYLDMVDSERRNPPQADALPQQNSAGGQASRRARKTALEAADLVSADVVYFVLNDYWWAYEKILAEATLEADEIKNINDGEVFVFKYTDRQ